MYTSSIRTLSPYTNNPIEYAAIESPEQSIVTPSLTWLAYNILGAFAAAKTTGSSKIIENSRMNVILAIL